MPRHWHIAPLLACLGWASMGAHAAPRERIEILSTPESYGIATAIAHGFAKTQPFEEPRVESLADAAARFCADVGLGSPDYLVTSRALGDAEQRSCRAAGVTPVEVILGGAGLVVLRGAALPPFDLSRRDLYLAIAATVPSATGEQLAGTTSKTWKNIRPSLPGLPIEIIGPPPESEAGHALADLVLKAGARDFAALAALESRDSAAFEALAGATRAQPAFREMRPGDSAAQLAERSPNALVITDLTVLRSAQASRALKIEGVSPSAASVRDGTYALAEPVRLILKREHVGIVPGLEAFLDEALGGGALGESGYLRPAGLVPAPRGAHGVTAGAILSKTR